MLLQTIRMENIDDSFSRFRLTSPEHAGSMQRSLAAVGQLQAVIVRSHGSGYQLLDGFKRFSAAGNLKWETLECRIVQADDLTAKVMILTYNSHAGCLQAYEQACIIYSLKKEHLLCEDQIARMLSRSISWVSRRLSFIERLEDSVGVHLRLGRITSTHARELSRLPRGKQGVFLKLIVDHGLTSRHTALLAGKYLQAKSSREQEYLVSHPMEVIERATLEVEVHDSRLSSRGNQLLKTSRMLMHYQHVFIGQGTNPPLKELPALELDILSPCFADIARKGQMLVSILKSYYHER